MDCDLRPLRVSGVLVPVLRCEEIRAADREQRPEADDEEEPCDSQPHTGHRKSIHSRVSSGSRTASIAAESRSPEPARGELMRVINGMNTTQRLSGGLSDCTVAGRPHSAG